MNDSLKCNARLPQAFAAIAVLLYGAVTPLAEAATLLRYDFSNGSGATVTDLSGSGNHGTLVGFSDTSAGAGAFAASEGWVSGGGLSTLDDSVSSYVDTPLALSAIGNLGFTLEYIATFTAPDQGTSGTANSFAPAIGGSAVFDDFKSLMLFGRRDNIGLEARLPGTGSSSVPVTGLQPWTSGSANDLHHVALVYAPAFPSGGDVRVYIDGALSSDPDPVTLSTANLAAALGNFRIGGTGHDPALEWDGVFYGAAISNEPLAPESFVLSLVPEPASLCLIGLGALALSIRRGNNR
jgi:hypothetical protein